MASLSSPAGTARANRLSGWMAGEGSSSQRAEGGTEGERVVARDDVEVDDVAESAGGAQRAQSARLERHEERAERNRLVDGELGGAQQLRVEVEDPLHLHRGEVELHEVQWR